MIEVAVGQEKQGGAERSSAQACYNRLGVAARIDHRAGAPFQPRAYEGHYPAIGGNRADYD